MKQILLFFTLMIFALITNAQAGLETVDSLAIIPVQGGVELQYFGLNADGDRTIVIKSATYADSTEVLNEARNVYQGLFFDEAFVKQSEFFEALEIVRTKTQLFNNLIEVVRDYEAVSNSGSAAIDYVNRYQGRIGADMGINNFTYNGLWYNYSIEEGPNLFYVLDTDIAELSWTSQSAGAALDTIAAGDQSFSALGLPLDGTGFSGRFYPIYSQTFTTGGFNSAINLEAMAYDRRYNDNFESIINNPTLYNAIINKGLDVAVFSNPSETQFFVKIFKP